MLIWWLAEDPALGAGARGAISNPEADVYVSAASAWEISIKHALSKIDAPDDLEGQLRHHNFTALGISVRHALAAGALPRHHDDPFDRMLVAQAWVEGLTLVTGDPRLGLYDVKTLPADR